MDVIFAHHSFQYSHIFGVTDLHDEGATATLDISLQDGISVFISYNIDKDRLKIETDYMEADKVFIGAEDFVTDGFDDGESPKNPVKISSVNGVERIKGPIHFGGKETVILGNEDFQDEVNIARTALFELADEIADELLK